MYFSGMSNLGVTGVATVRFNAVDVNSCFGGFPSLGGIGDIYNHPIRQYIPLIYLPLIVLANWVIICYRSHLLREPGNSIDDGLNLRCESHGGCFPFFCF